MLRFSAAGATHVGLVRTVNQDSLVITPGLLLVADGVGGGAAGEVASAGAAASMLESVRVAGARTPVLVLAEAVRRAQEHVAAAVAQVPAREGMATTLTALLTNGVDTAMVHLGDSRAYAWREDHLIQLSRDHTWTARAVDRGVITQAEADAHPWRNVILRSVNGTIDQGGDVLPLALRTGDRLLLASDGLTDLVPAEDIERLFAEPDDRQLCDLLVEAALARGGRDNVSVVVATVGDRDGEREGDPGPNDAANWPDPVVMGALAERS